MPFENPCVEQEAKIWECVGVSRECEYQPCPQQSPLGLPPTIFSRKNRDFLSSKIASFVTILARWKAIYAANFRETTKTNTVVTSTLVHAHRQFGMRHIGHPLDPQITLLLLFNCWSPKLSLSPADCYIDSPPYQPALDWPLNWYYAQLMQTVSAPRFFVRGWNTVSVLSLCSIV